MFDLLNQSVSIAMQTLAQGIPGAFAYRTDLPALKSSLNIPFPAAALLLWQLREHDLQHSHPLHTDQVRSAFLGWCLQHGRQEYRLLRELPDWWQALQQPAHTDIAQDSDDAAHVLSHLQYLLVRQRPDLSCDVQTPQGRAALLIWYLQCGRQEAGLNDLNLPETVKRWLLARSTHSGLNRLQTLLHRSRPDLQQHFPLPEQRAAYLDWCRAFFQEHPSLLDALRMTPGTEHASAAVPHWRQRPFGVNLIGDVYSAKGVAEDVRMAARALRAAGIPCVLLHFGTCVDSSTDADLVDLLASPQQPSQAIYAFNLFCMTATEHARCVLEWGGEWLRGHYSIGYWPWEMAQWPREWQHLLCLADEIWCSSAHTTQALRAVGLRPVREMPMALCLPEQPMPNFSRRTKLRRKFGLPLKAFIFLFIFDLNSSTQRKNPQACIDAFLQAFPASSETEVGLAIKVLPPAADDPDWLALQSLQAADARIHLL